MLQMGRYEQAGSGVYNVTKYLPIYTPGAVPVFEEYADVFETTIPLTDSESSAGAQVTPEVTPQVAPHVTPEVAPHETAQVEAQVGAQVAGEVTGEVASEVTGEVIRFLRVLAKGPHTRSEAQAKLGLKGQANFRDRYLVPAMDADLIEMTIPDKPKSRLQKYRLTSKGRALLASENA